MPLPTEFWEELPQKTDAELYDIIAHKGDYLPEALEAAAEELRKRNLPAERLTQLRTAVEEQDAQTEARAQEPLSWPMRILIPFTFCLGGLGVLLVWYYFYSQGYKRKARESWISVVVFLGLILLFGLLGRLIR